MGYGEKSKTKRLPGLSGSGAFKEKRMKIEVGTPALYGEIQRFLEDVYGHSSGAFSEGWPQVWRKEHTALENSLLVREGGRIVSFLRIFPLSIVHKGARIKAAGIGSVSTLYSHRGRGYMSALLMESFARMRRDGFPVSILWGDSHRYGHFGYEDCGSSVHLAINSRGLKASGVPPLEARRYFGEKDILGEIRKAYNSNSYRMERIASDFRTVYSGRGSATYYGFRGNLFAYLTISSTESGEKGSVKEFGGSPELLLGLLGHLSERFGITGFRLSFPGLGEVPRILLEASSGWTVGKTCMLKIIDLRETLRIISGRSDFFFPGGAVLTLTVKNGQSVTLSRKGRAVSVKEGKGGVEVVLEENEMTRLLFGQTFWAPEEIDRETYLLLKRFLPVGFFVGHMDTV